MIKLSNVYLEAVYRYYESRRRMYLDEQPERAAIKAENDRKTKLKSRQRQVCICFSLYHFT